MNALYCVVVFISILLSSIVFHLFDVKHSSFVFKFIEEAHRVESIAHRKIKVEGNSIKNI